MKTLLKIRLLTLIGLLLVFNSCKKESGEGVELVFNIVGVNNGGSNKLGITNLKSTPEIISKQKVALGDGNYLSIELQEGDVQPKGKFASTPIYQALPAGTILHYGVFTSAGAPVKSGSITYTPGNSYPSILLPSGNYKIIFIGSINNVLPAIDLDVALADFQLSNLPITSNLILFEKDLNIVGQNTIQNINIVMTHQLTRIKAILDGDGAYAPGLAFGDMEILNSYDSYNFKLSNPKILKSGAKRVAHFSKNDDMDPNTKVIEYPSDIIITGTDPMDSLELIFKDLEVSGLTQNFSIKLGGFQSAKSYVIKLELFREFTESTVTYAPGNLIYRNESYLFAGAQDLLGDLWVWRRSGSENQFAPILAGGGVGPYIADPCGQVTGYGTGWVMMGEGNYVNKVTTGSFSNGNAAFKINGNGAIYNGTYPNDRAYYGPQTAKTSYGFYIGLTAQPTENLQTNNIFLPAGSGSIVNPPVSQDVNSEGIYWINNYSAAETGSWGSGMLYFKNYHNVIGNKYETTFLRGNQTIQGRIRCIK